MIPLPQMAFPVTNKCPNIYPNLVGQSSRRSGGLAPLVEPLRQPSKKDNPYNTTEIGSEANLLTERRGSSSIIDLTESPIATQYSISVEHARRDYYELGIRENKIKKRERLSEPPEEIVETSQDSQPVRQAKRRRKIDIAQGLESAGSSSPISAPRKCTKRVLVKSSAKKSISEKDLPLNQKDEIEDSYEANRTPESSPLACIIVEIPIYENFDRDAYAKVCVSSTQSTSISPTERAYFFPAARQSSPSSRFSEVIIPDSQDVLTGSTTEPLPLNTVINPTDTRAGARISASSNTGGKRPNLALSTPSQISVTASVTSLLASDQRDSVSNSTESWQGAQIVTPLELSVSQTAPAGVEFEIFQDDKGNKDSFSQQKLSQTASSNSALSQRDSNSQPHCSQTKRSKLEDSRSQHSSPSSDQRHFAERVTPEESQQSFVGEELDGSPQRRPSPPLKSLHTLDTSYTHHPARPQTPSDIEMSELAPTSTSSKVSYAELASQARDKVRARLDVPQAVTNPEVLSSSPAPVVPHQMLPVRENLSGLPPPNPMEDSQDDDEQSSETAEIALNLPTMGQNDHVILLPLASMVRNVYRATITNRRREIMAVINGDEIDPNLLAQIDSMVEELKMLTDHQDLITEISLTQSNVPDDYQAKWAETCSSKCLFVRYFLDNLRGEEKHVAILVRPGRMLDILESILKVKNFIYERPDQQSRSNNRASGPLRVTLLPTGLGGGQHVINRADIVIAFDETFRIGEQYSKHLRNHLYEAGKLSPLISLVVANSAEHLEFCLPTFDDPVERKKCLVNFIAQKRDEVGELDEGQLWPQQAAEAVAQYFSAGGSTWPLLVSPDITGLKVQDFNHQRQIQAGLISQSQDQELLPMMTQHGSAKRALRADSMTGPDIDSSKRMRMTPTRGDIASSGDVTRVSDTVGHRTQMLPNSTGVPAYEVIAKVDALDEEQSGHVSSLLEKVDDLEGEIQTRQTTEQQLRSMVKSLEARLDDYVATIKKLEPKLLQAIADRHKFQVERDAAKSQAVTVNQSVEARITEITKLKADKVNLEQELAMARNSLVNSTVPEVAMLAQTQEQLRALQIDKEKLEKRISAVQKDFEFTRDMYQKASSHTSELRNELSELKDENAILKGKASENVVRIAEIQRANETKEREERIDELEALLRDRDQELRKKTEELKIKTNGRRETRGTSVPRSPRMGSGAMSPRPHFSRPAGGSRGGSPAPGEGFRDPTLFSSSALASARWPHLTDR